MEPLNLGEAMSADERIAWAKRAGLTEERIAFLLACPKFTRTGRNDKPAYIKTENPNHHLQKLGDCWWLRIRRRKTNIVHNLGKDLETARKHRDEMLVAYDAGLPIPHLDTK
jgi:hypothetical protein